jgi:hypothetical protein
LLEFVKDYRKVLNQLEDTLGDDFPLWDVIEKFDREQDFAEELTARRQRQGLPAEGATPPAGDSQTQADESETAPAGRPAPPPAQTRPQSAPAESASDSTEK